MDNIEVVKEMYQAFLRGDIPAILDKLDPAVEWDTVIPAPGVPWLQPRHGAAAVPAFFESLASLAFERFEPHTVLAEGNTVFALIRMEMTHIASGKRYTFPHEGHLWVFNESGKVAKYQHVTDTALHQHAAKGE